MEQFKSFMQEALNEAKLAASANEVPVGAVIVHDNQIIARAHNSVEDEPSVTRHAELKVIEQASRKLGNWRLSEASLYVTLEPCPMCAGAIRLSRISTVVFGARDERLGAFGSLYDLSQDVEYGPTPRVVSGVYADECAELLKNFFKSRRSS